MNVGYNNMQVRRGSMEVDYYQISKFFLKIKTIKVFSVKIDHNFTNTKNWLIYIFYDTVQLEFIYLLVFKSNLNICIAKPR